MKTNYEKFLELEKEDHLTEQRILEHLNCSKVKARMLHQQLIRKKIIVKGKVVNPEEFRGWGLAFLVYDEYAEIEVGLESIIDNVLIDDEKFIRLIHNKVDPAFRKELSSEMRKNTLKILLGLGEDQKYLIYELAVQALAESLRTSKDLIAPQDTPEGLPDADGVVITLDTPEGK